MINESLTCTAALAAALIAGPAAAQSAGDETVVLKFSHVIPDLRGKSLIVDEVAYPPGGKSAPHRHAKSASVYAYVLSGSIRSQVEGQPEHVYRAGESFFEAPGSHHVIGENASKTEPAKLLAVFVVDTGDNVLTIPDK